MIQLDTIQGHWVRRWIKAPGFKDYDTRVHWIQAGTDYADVRIPLHRPDPKAATCLAELTAKELRALAYTEGFAGHVTLQDDTLTWHREINWHGTPDGMDTGKISFNSEGEMIETGVLADYSELWVQNSDTVPSGIRFANDAYQGVLVMTGKVAVVGIGRPMKPTTTSVIALLEDEQIPPDIVKAFDGLPALCHLSNGRATAVLATNPFLEGQQVLSIRNDTVIWHQVGYDGTTCSIEMRIRPKRA